MPRALEIKPGDTFGRFRIVCEVERHRKPSGASVRVFKCVCECGREKVVRLSSLREGVTVSCGCFHRENAAHTGRSNLTTHGMSKSGLYQIWTQMKGRCHNPVNKSYGRYGARGISVCPEWRSSFEAFAAHVGEKPKGLTLDRINSGGNYEPGNVRWATYTEQARNTRRNIWVNMNGARLTLVEACQKAGFSYDNALYAIHKHGEYQGVKRVQP